MWIFVALIIVLVGSYLIINGRRNSDPLNRKRAAEICEYLTESGNINLDEIRDIFMRNARYKKQADHIVSMVPAILIQAGYPKDAAMNVVPLLRAAADQMPR